MATETYDKTRLANFGRNVANDYARWRKSADKMMEEIHDAMDAGLSAEDIEVALLGRCNDRAQMQDVLATLEAMVQMGRLGPQFEDVMKRGIRPRRI